MIELTILKFQQFNTSFTISFKRICRFIIMVSFNLSDCQIVVTTQHLLDNMNK